MERGRTSDEVGYTLFSFNAVKPEHDRLHTNVKHYTKPIPKREKNPYLVTHHGVGLP